MREACRLYRDEWLERRGGDLEHRAACAGFQELFHLSRHVLWIYFGMVFVPDHFIDYFRPFWHIQVLGILRW